MINIVNFNRGAEGAPYRFMCRCVYVFFSAWFTIQVVKLENYCVCVCVFVCLCVTQYVCTNVLVFIPRYKLQTSEAVNATLCINFAYFFKKIAYSFIMTVHPRSCAYSMGVLRRP